VDYELSCADGFFVTAFQIGCKVNLVKPLFYPHPTPLLSFDKLDRFLWLIICCFRFLDRYVDILRRFFDILSGLKYWLMHSWSDIEFALEGVKSFHRLLANNGICFLRLIIITNNDIRDLVCVGLKRTLTWSRLRKQDFDLM